MRRRPRALLAILAGTALVGCAGAPQPEVHRGEVRAVTAGALGAADVADAEWAFGLDLLHAVCSRQPGTNVLLSPTSAAQALGMLQPAARGATADAVAATLHRPAWDDDLVAAAQEHTAALAALDRDGDRDDEDAPDMLSMSNRIWTAPDLEPTDAYLDDVATAFDADVRSLDFAADPEGATDRVNRTIEDDTHGLIPVLFEEPLPAVTVAVLTNALYLDAAWLTPFTDTAPAPFHAPDGDTTAQMMSGSSGTARSADGWLAVDLPYRDGTLLATVLLPPEGADPCTVDGDALTAVDDAPGSDAAVLLPRLHLEQTHQLLDLLTGLGFPATGDFSGLGQEELVLSAVVQKTVMDVDEEGTVAAAATGEAMAGSAPTPEVVVVDRPYLMLLRDTATRSPLFVAVVQDPSRR